MSCAFVQRPHRAINVALFSGDSLIVHPHGEPEHGIFNGIPHDVIDDMDDIIIDGMYLAMEHGLPEPTDWIAMTQSGLTYMGSLMDDNDNKGCDA